MRLIYGIALASVVALMFAGTYWQDRRRADKDRQRLDELVRRLPVDPRPELWAEWRDLHRRHPEWGGK